ncbi:MAG: WecB/TagA/CpsF family glycosyltransferase [Tannerellaceae bacterium]|jgi:N-acetylglucosaminyldiphosphoundecaprenol N-acetyl-beta-D-mannosaminyltransferase|nr:WecB/TagA/CpsF family glycosyltransferase [Tannerellaceae bacterium]
MNTYFNVPLEFDVEVVHRTIEEALKAGAKGYVCVMESNNLAVSQRDAQLMKIVNSALVNICDGSNIAWLLGCIHKQPFRSYTGNEVFLHFISQKKYTHYFLGNTRPVLDSLRENLAKTDPRIQSMVFCELPFCKVEDFDYPRIAEAINAEAPDMIWVSLGAPKQENFMSALCPYLKKGILFGVGAAFNFNAHTGSVKRAPEWMRNLRLEWLYRAYEEPRKNVPRYWNFLRLLPGLAFREWRFKRAGSLD